MKITSTAVCLSLCAGCMIDREIGTPDLRELATRAPATDLTPPPPPTKGPCCTAGPQVGLDDPESVVAGPPTIAWDGAAWAVAWNFNRQQPVIRMMAGDTPGASLAIDPGQADMSPTAIGFHRALSDGGGRHLLALRPSTWVKWPDQDPYARLVLVDDTGMKQASRDIEPSAEGGIVVWAGGLGSWAFASCPDDRQLPAPSRLMLLDETLGRLSASKELGIPTRDDAFSISVLSLGDRVITVVPSDDGVHIRTFAGKSLEEPHPELILDAGTAPVPVPPLGGRGGGPAPEVGSVAAAVVRDRVVIAASNGENIRSWSYDPSTGQLAGGPTVVGTSTRIGRMSIGGDSLGGSAGICFAIGDGPGNPDGLQFALVGPDGLPRGQPITLASGLRYVATCDVASGGPDEYLVVFWNAAKETSRHSLIAGRVLVQRPAPKID